MRCSRLILDGRMRSISYPDLSAWEGVGSAITSLSFPPDVRASSLRRSTVTCGSWTPRSRSCWAMARSRPVSSPSSLPTRDGVDGWRGTMSTRNSGPSWMTWNSPTWGSRVNSAKCRGVDGDLTAVAGREGEDVVAAAVDGLHPGENASAGAGVGVDGDDVSLPVGAAAGPGCTGW
jgi:hypothetical protein